MSVGNSSVKTKNKMWMPKSCFRESSIKLWMSLERHSSDA